VPPVEIRATPRSCSLRANSTIPVLSETEIRARVTRLVSLGICSSGFAPHLALEIPGR